jgi:PKD repeat protein
MTFRKLFCNRTALFKIDSDEPFSLNHITPSINFQTPGFQLSAKTLSLHQTTVMKTKSTLLIAFLLGSALQLNAQQTLTCQHPNTDTESLKRIKSLLTHSQKSTDLKIIPVVFHVLHQYGSENISDAQIGDALDLLNKDFKKLNPDTVQVISPFDTIIGNVNFDFRLATIDPNGNPTSGIDRIFTPLTNMADDASKINSWDPQRYMNIWIVKTLGSSGISGYATNPLALMPDACKDGIMMLNDYVGSIGTGSPIRYRFLTHEVSHYFGLFHLMEDPSIFGDCGYSDGIDDTPHTNRAYICFNEDYNTCNDSLYAESFNYWGFDAPDMEENFQAVGYCMRMFTKGQVTMMRSVVESPLYGRDQLWTNANLVATGVGPGTAPVSTAVPSSDFGVKTHVFGTTFGMFTCVGDSVSFLTASGQGNAVSYQWSFPGGSPSSSTLANPKTAYMNPGYYDATLTVTNANGSSTTTKSAVVYVSGSWPEYTGPSVQNFDQSGNFWQSENVNHDSGSFQRILSNGTQNTGCFQLGNHYEPDSAEPCLADPLQINGNKDILVSPAFDLSNTTGVTISFDYAYGSAVIPDSATEVLKIYYSRDCGKTWIQKKIIEDTALVTGFASQSSYFTPAQNQWKHVSLTHVSTTTDTKTRFKFEFTASNYSNNFYLDNFVIDGILGIADSELSGIGVFPNPSQEGGTISISGLNASKSEITIKDIQGKLVCQKELSGSEVQLNTDLKAGCYLVEITQNGSKFLTRLIIE